MNRFLEIVNNFPVVGVEIGGQTVPVSFDLGGDHTIELTAQALSRIEVRYLQERYTWMDARGHTLEARKFAIPEGIDGFIGYDFFAKHTVCVDFPGRAFWIR